VASHPGRWVIGVNVFFSAYHFGIIFRCFYAFFFKRDLAVLFLEHPGELQDHHDYHDDADDIKNAVHTLSPAIDVLSIDFFNCV
jgi:hypothetical protein